MQKPNILDLKAVEKEVQSLLKDSSFVSHSFEHVKRVASGASYFTALDNGDEIDKSIAYVAGLIHDLGRPKSEYKDHSKSSEESAREFLKRFDCNGKAEEVVNLVANHRQMTDCRTRDRSVYIADKVLEQMGAYLAFRGAVYATEMEEFADRDEEGLMDAQCDVTTKRMETYPVEGFPKKIRTLTKYQRDLALNFVDHLRKGDDWAVSLATFCYERIKAGTAGSVDNLVRSYNPISMNDMEYKKEAMWYLTASPEEFCRDFIES